MLIHYEECSDIPGMRLFRCEALRANLTPEACSRNVTNNATIQCARCPIGTVHVAACAPQALTKLTWQGPRYRGVQPAKSCVRCCTKTYRLVRSKSICISCYNRERELRVGSNAKGTPPRKAAAALHRAVCLVDLWGDALLLEFDYCSGPAEAARRIQRQWPGARLEDYERQPAVIGVPAQTELPVAPTSGVLGGSPAASSANCWPRAPARSIA